MKKSIVTSKFLADWLRICKISLTKENTFSSDIAQSHEMRFKMVEKSLFVIPVDMLSAYCVVFNISYGLRVNDFVA